MGIGNILKCNHCDYEVELFEGVGMMMGPYKYMLLPSNEKSGWTIVKSKRILKKVEDLMVNKKGIFIVEGKNVPDYIRNRFKESIDIKEEYDDKFAYGYRIYYSYNTNQAYSLFHFIIKYEENNEIKYYEPEYVDKYKKPLVMLKNIYDLPLEGVVCPKCKKVIEQKEGEFYFCCWD